MTELNQEEVLQHEKERWDQVFNDELNKKEFIKFSSFWWEDYYNKISKKVASLFLKNKKIKILEAGSGSGKASLLLPIKAQIHLLDISFSALEYAKFLKNKLGINNDVTYKVGSIFNIDYTDKEFDLCWGIGVIEHYNKEDISKLIKEMLRVTKGKGYVMIGVPNKYSGPIIKAKLLNLKLLKIIPGYRLDSEKFFSNKEILELVEKASNELGREIIGTEITYFGNPLIMETPKFILKTIGVIVDFIFVKNRFLKLYIIKIK